MKKIISFSLFASIVILALAAKNSASAQSTRPVISQSSNVVRVKCLRTGYRWGNALPVILPGNFRRQVFRWQAGPVRRERYS